MKTIILFLFLVIIPFSSPRSEAINLNLPSQTIGIGSPPPVEKNKTASKKRRKKQNTRRSKTTKKINNNVPGFSIMLIGGVLLLCLSIFFFVSVLLATNGIAASFNFFFGFITAIAGLALTVLGIIYVLKSNRDNQVFEKYNQKKERQIRKELAMSVPKKFPHFTKRNIRYYIDYTLQTYHLKTAIATKKAKPSTPALERIIKKKKRYLEYYNRLLKELEEGKQK